MAKIKCTQWTLGNSWQHLRHLVKIEHHTFCGASSSYMICQNMSTPSLIGHRELNLDDRPQSISFELLIKDEEANQSLPNVAY